MIQARYTSCLRACELCADACHYCAVSCLGECQVASMTRCIRLDLECAALCRTAADVLARDGECIAGVLDLCREICMMCHDECRRHEAAHCQACANTCHLCAEECQALASELGKH